MVKVPIGKIVRVDLWDSKKKRGMVKYFTNTMDLVRAESEFDLQKGDNAIVVESHDSFVLIVPKDRYTNLLNNNNPNDINYKGLAQEIYNILKDRIEEQGGILTFEDLFSIFMRTSIQYILTKRHLKKALRNKDLPFDKIKENGISYLALKPAEIACDQLEILTIGKQHPYLTVDIIQNRLKWQELRILRTLEYLLKQGRCRIDENYRTGNRYYFILD